MRGVVAVSGVKPDALVRCGKDDCGHVALASESPGNQHGYHHDLRCAKCGTTKLDTSALNAAYKAAGLPYDYGDDNFLRQRSQFKEACCVAERGAEGALFWHLPDGRSAGGIPDSRSLWDVLWQHRDKDLIVAHTHPRYGTPQASLIDYVTFQAVEAGLGKRLVWCIASGDKAVCLLWQDELQGYVNARMKDAPPWLGELRKLSGY